MAVANTESVLVSGHAGTKPSSPTSESVLQQSSSQGLKANASPLGNGDHTKRGTAALTKADLGRTAIFNWMTVAAALGVAFFLSPYIVRHLGGVGYGVWTLVNSLVAYMSVLDFGLRGAVTRFVSRYHAQEDHKAASSTVSAAFWLRVWISLGILVGSLILSRLANTFFSIPPFMQNAASWAILIAGTSLAVTLTFGIFAGVLAALNRFDLICAVTVSQTILRAVGTILILRSGHGIVALAMWELFVVILANAALTTLSLRVYSEIRLLFKKPDSSVLRQLGGYSFYVVLLNACGQVITYTDNVVVGSIVGVAAVTIFTIAGGLLEYTRQMVSALGMAFLPFVSSMDARGERDQVQRFLIQGTCAVLLVALPIQVALFFRGETFIGLWMGKQYAEASGTVLRILLISQVFMIADYAGYNIAYGLSKHRPIALRMIAEAAANLILSVFLARKIGLVGVAWGTVIPGVINHLFFGPQYMCRVLNTPLRQFYYHGLLRSLLAMIPFAVSCYLVDRYWSAGNLLQFILQMMVICPFIALGVVVLFRKEVFEQWSRIGESFTRNRSTESSLGKSARS
jgi:O-antigen/teichoic acid export membrane protein